MTSPGEMMALAERIEQADGADCDLDHAIHDLVGDNDGAPLYTASLDAAMTLKIEGWSTKLYLHGGKCFAEVYRLGDVIQTDKAPIRPYASGGAPVEGGPSATGALALSAAWLRARAAIAAMGEG